MFFSYIYIQSERERERDVNNKYLISFEILRLCYITLDIIYTRSTTHIVIVNDI